MNTQQKQSMEAWGSRMGLILAMAGNAVGLGNFLRFPHQAAVNGGGTFMITYFIALLLLGIPLMWIEWGLGRKPCRSCVLSRPRGADRYGRKKSLTSYCPGRLSSYS